MTVNDFSLIGKKILIGLIVAIVPFIILFGGLLLTQKLLKADNQTKQTGQLLTKPESKP